MVKSSELDMEYSSNSSCQIEISLKKPASGEKASVLRPCQIGGNGYELVHFEDSGDMFGVSYQLFLKKERQISFIESRTFAYGLLLNPAAAALFVVGVPISYWYYTFWKRNNQIMDKIIEINIQNRAGQTTQAPEIEPSVDDEEPRREDPSSIDQLNAQNQNHFQPQERDAPEVNEARPQLSRIHPEAQQEEAAPRVGSPLRTTENSAAKMMPN